MTTITFNNANLSDFLTKFDVGVSGAYISLSVNSSEKLKLNYGVGEKQNRIVGNPDISAIKTKFIGNTNYLVSEFNDTDALTIFTIAKRPSSGSTDAVAFSNHNGSAQIGAGLFWYANGNLSFAAARQTTTGSTTSAGISIAGLSTENWAFVCGETSSNTPNKITNMTTGASLQSALTTPRVLFDANKFRVGSSYYSAFSGDIDHFMTVAFNKVLTAEEKETVAKAMRNLANSYGIVV